MTFSHVLVGLATGLPVMIVVGPIALLLVEEGMQHGVRRSAPAILGVASVDLLFSSVASLAGVGVVSMLESAESGLKVLATLVLSVIAVSIWRAAHSDLRSVGRCDQVEEHQQADGFALSDSVHPFELVPSDSMSLATAGPPAGDTGTRSGDAFGAEAHPVGSGGEAVSSLAAVEDSLGRSARRMARFFGATALNPITIVVFTSLVLSGRDGVGTPGWVIGMTMASLLVGVTFVTVGHVLGAVLNERATAQLRMGGAVLIAAMAAWFLFA